MDTFLYHAEAVSAVFGQLRSSDRGLSEEEATTRLVREGENSLPSAAERVTWLHIFFYQWKSPLIFILLLAGIVSGALREYTDMAVIFMTVGINVFIGFFQEYKANNALQRLQNMVAYKALVVRGGERRHVESERLVPGDVLVLSAGDRIQADGRIIEAIQLEVDEAPLTGESAPVRKHAQIVSVEASLADRTNMGYRGTLVVAGRGALLVTATGKNTEIGRIAWLVQETATEKTPLQAQLATLGRQLGVVVGLIAVGIMAVGLFSARHYGLLFLFQTSVAVAVAAIPEGLVISLTVILAIGMQQILKRRALVRRLLAAETLGSVNVICVDKTGTLTAGTMRVTEIVAATENTTTSSFLDFIRNGPSRHHDLWFVLRIGVLCNDAMSGVSANGEKIFTGDTTETAIAALGGEAGLRREELELVMPRVAELPFHSDHKLMATVHKIDHEWLFYVKGAPEVVLSRATHYEERGERRPLSTRRLNQFREEAVRMGQDGLRVLGMAYRADKAAPSKELHERDLQHLVFVGLIGLSDPIRGPVPETIRQAAAAGIRTIMVTGDQAQTARTIGRAVGLDTSGTVIDGVALETMNDGELTDAVKKVSIFARVSPQHKIRIVRALQKNGDVVAMTGDGVNDAPALKAADIGVAVGSGTDVAREVADLVLLDDSFTTIVVAIEEGRRIYENIKKVVLYLLVGSLSEVLLIVVSMLAGLPLALLPAQILWINIIQEIFPTMALAFDPGDEKNMIARPRPKSASLLDRSMKIVVAIMTVVTNGLLFFLFWSILGRTADIALSRTVVFAGLAAASLMYLYAIRSRRHIWRGPLFDNWHLTAAVLFGWLALIGAVYFQPLRVMLHTVPLSSEAWAIVIGFGILNVGLVEVIKKLPFYSNPRQALLS
ncbi:MAG: HAD-IC family P-type ATPase [Candidatus Magasanikbacteria bacterium]|nr:HAD-IC family P-type ATPase [Candidatus Magasanikbacteria bacterium]